MQICIILYETNFFTPHLISKNTIEKNLQAVTGAFRSQLLLAGYFFSVSSVHRSILLKLSALFKKPAKSIRIIGSDSVTVFL